MADRDTLMIREAMKEAGHDLGLILGSLPGVCRKLLELERSGWQPVDPDVLAVREVLAIWEGNDTDLAATIRAGGRDANRGFQAALTAYRKHKEPTHAVS